MKRGWLVVALLFLAVVISGRTSIARSLAQQKPSSEKAKDKPKAGAAEVAQPGAQAVAQVAEEERERQVMERFLGVLEKNPRRGTALDRVYGHHVERGSIEAFVKKYQERTAKDPKDGTAWMVLALLESQRGRDAAAVVAFRQAEKHRDDDPLPAYYLGQALVLVGQPDEAAQAFERAIQRKPNRADLLEIFQALGRVYQRSQRGEQALEVWNRLEKIFPDDLRVQEQIATTLVEEGQHEQALPRYETLVKKTQDEYRKSLFKIETAELKVRLGQTPKALADFENLLGQLNPESWLYREVRRKVEEVFLRNDDLAGLSKYYESWIAKNPDDIEAMARLARTLAQQGRGPESQGWLDKSIKLAPKRKELRLALIEQYVYEQKFPEALAQYEALVTNDPNNPDYIREWGKLILKDKSKPEAERKQAAATVWRRLIEAKPKDPVVHTQVADLFRQAELTEEAVAYYKKAIELAPDAPQYYEYLGEYYHTLKRSEEALASWRQIAAGKNRTAKNLARLSEVFSGFGYLKEAIVAAQEAVELDKNDFGLVVKYADLLTQVERYDDALKQLQSAEKLAANAEENEQVLQQQIKCYQAKDTLNAEIDQLRKELKESKEAKRWFLLARYLEAQRQLPEATAAILKSLELDGQSIPAWAAAARIQESAGSLLAAAESNRKLAAIDRRYRTEYLTSVAKLESRLGRREQALQAGRDLLAAAPGNPDHYKFFAELCFQLGNQDEEGFDALRRSVRVNPSDPQVILTLAAALGERFRTDEAIELYWRAFEKHNEMEGKLAAISRLAELYLQTNHFDRLVERLERERREPDKQREMTLCLAQAYHAAGDYGTSRQELERLLSQNPRDTQLLTQLSNLSETEGDLASAVKYQQQLNKTAPAKENELRLAQLLARSGEAEEAGSIYVRLATSEQEPHRALAAVDSLLQNAKHDTVLVVTERMLRDNPKNWEVLYREGVALMGLEKPAEAMRRFQAVLDLRLADDEQSVAEKAKKKSQPGRQAGTSRSQLTTQQDFPLQNRLNNIWEVRRSTGHEPRYYYYGQQLWLPHDFGQARMAALGWQLSHAQKEGKHEEFLKKLRDQAMATQIAANDRARLDWFYLLSVKQDQKELYDAAKALAKGIDPAGHYLYLTSLPNRVYGGRGRRVVYQQTGNVDNTPPLPNDELDLVTSCYGSLKARRPEWLTQLVLQNVMTELKRAKRTEDEDKVYKAAVEAANQLDTVNGAIHLAAIRGDVDGLVKLYDKLDRLLGNKPAQGSYQYYGYGYGYVGTAADALGRAMSKRADDKAHPDVLHLLDRYLATRIRESKLALASRRPGSGQQYYGGHYHYQIWMGPNQRGVNLDFPYPNDYFDHGAIQLLRQAFELYKRDDLLSDLFKHLRDHSVKGPDSDKVYYHLGMGYLHWWNADKEAALKELTAASDSAASDLSLRLEVAGLRERNGEPDEALAMIDALTPLDNQIMQRREQMAMRLAVMTGNVERARTAADRLFGLRLDADTQVQLAGKMRELGMHEAAEAVLARARRQAGNRVSALVNLMVQYQNQSKLDVAVQVAHQILRRGPSRQFTPYYGGGEDDYARQQAVQVLARSGRLQDLIERAEAQLKSSPKSMQVHQTLAEYYRAAGNREKVKAMYEKMAELKPDDARLRYQVAQQLVQAGEPNAALDHYRAALKKEPSFFGHNYWEIRQVFEQANKLDELVKLFDEIDIKQMGHYYYVMDFVQNFLQNEKTREQGLKLFRKAWQAFPDQRAYLLSNIHHDEIWKLSEMYDFLRQAVVPGEGQAIVDPWQGFDQITSWSGDGKINTVIGRLVEAAARQNKLEVLYKETEETSKKLPDWAGGKALLAVLNVRLNRIDAAKQAVQEILDDKDRPLPLTPRWAFAQELENYGPLTDLVVKMHEGGIKEALVDENTQFSYSPVLRLVHIYKRQGRNEDARALVLKFSKADVNYPYDPHYAAYRKVENLSAIGNQLAELGYPADAVRIYNELLSDANRLQIANQWHGGGDRFTQTVQAGLTRAWQSLKPETMGQTIRELLKPPEGAKAGGPALDLLLTVQPREMNRAKLDSMLANALGKAANTPELMGQVKAGLSDLAKSRPQDVPVHVAAALTAFTEGKPESIGEAVKRLEGVVESQPLEELPPNTRANSRQRAEAAKQVGLWLVARECFKKEELRPAGEKLADRALEAARRQADNSYALAVLREWGDLDLKRGDKKAAEQRWTQMLEYVMTSKSAAPALEGFKP